MKKSKYSIKRRSYSAGFTLIELMITVAILAILSSVAIPSYLGYLRRSYVNEAVTSIAAIKSAEEQYFTTNNCYTEAAPSPTAIPSGTSVAWPSAAPPVGWEQAALAVRPDARVRFQYRVYATNAWSATNACGVAGGAASAAANITRVDTALKALGPSTDSCIADGVSANPNALINTAVFPNHWYAVVAEGNLDGNAGGSGSTNSILVSVTDDSRIIRCFEGE